MSMFAILVLLVVDIIQGSIDVQPRMKEPSASLYPSEGMQTE